MFAFCQYLTNNNEGVAATLHMEAVGSGLMLTARIKVTNTHSNFHCRVLQFWESFLIFWMKSLFPLFTCSVHVIICPSLHSFDLQRQIQPSASLCLLYTESCSHWSQFLPTVCKKYAAVLFLLEFLLEALQFYLSCKQAGNKVDEVHFHGNIQCRCTLFNMCCILLRL